MELVETVHAHVLSTGMDHNASLSVHAPTERRALTEPVAVENVCVHLASTARRVPLHVIATMAESAQMAHQVTEDAHVWTGTMELDAASHVSVPMAESAQMDLVEVGHAHAFQTSMGLHVGLNASVD